MIINQREALQGYLYELVHGERHGMLAWLLLGLLRVLSWLYSGIITVTLYLYKLGVLTQHKLPCKVISLGNITVGGTGKTPTAQRLAEFIRDMGYKVVILNRGYRSNWRRPIGLVSNGRHIYMTAGEAGDEAYLLAKNLPGVPVVIGKDRTVTGEYAVKELGAEVIILDDGYQHWQLARDLDIVLIDTLNRFGNDCVLPRGTLREPLSHLNRAHAFLLTKVDQSTDDARDTIRDTLLKYNDQAVIVESIHNPQSYIEIEDWYKDASKKNVPLAVLGDTKVLAFSGIGNPSSFEQTLSDVGTCLVASVRFSDHHHYTMLEMREIMDKAVSSGAQALVTTEKDAVKIPAEFIHSHRPLPVYVLDIRVKFVGGKEELMDLIKQTAKARSDGR